MVDPGGRFIVARARFVEVFGDREPGVSGSPIDLVLYATPSVRHARASCMGR